MVTPDGAEWAPRPRVDNAMVKALARAFRWRKMLDTGVHATLEDLARAKGVNATYVSRGRCHVDGGEREAWLDRPLMRRRPRAIPRTPATGVREGCGGRSGGAGR